MLQKLSDGIEDTILEALPALFDTSGGQLAVRGDSTTAAKVV